jgi:hypothetical protein
MFHPEHEQANKALAAQKNMVHYIGSGQIVVMVICVGHGLGVLATMGIQLHEEMY